MKTIIKKLGLATLLGGALLSCTEELPGVGSIEDLTPPSADFTYKASQTEFRDIEFTNTSISAGIFAWDFGDGGTSEDKNPVHTFSGEGTFEVSLTAKDGNDVTSDTTITVVVVDELVPEFQCPSFECSDRSVWGSFSGSGSPTPPDESTGAKIGNDSQYLDQTIRVTGGIEYRVSFWYVSKSGGTSAGKLVMEDPDNSITFVDEDLPLSASSSDYEQKSYIIKMDAATTQLRFAMNFGDVETRYDLVEIKKID
ncbi:PKD domain-containing protein [Flammeovirga yaeyamensis]|uniref:PKD domain-containing protein n=1 Tax=Flammeovirga yaeyamensis TaxID=367791 RepID=A0AAX1NC04_9BACT|nr:MULTISPECIES: PKD domain-containing protein [Flammeovirga]ANQ52437.1 PKD domain-containing protein [Flammeovirga sp. MY04]MBB3699872.1 PKD repeat protein [Flammeovirga yaeyamensis]NMF38331.1 PKD domain-containing protein [Flammeovirga yaeyamensis]QWG04742.1 PKD domain-containing protein [Flammeovirga yaeyamensis]